ncbi:hypothetical protein BDN72DRAFT_881834 [Pluteus cervinus]|uniref:Uncharacterized protein n=1 Tax=Pluteus cervinus TaxID=181527 RepID=A0ACD3ADG3_9AGAR|nr:hypothetical protein BDN72DRAFT_881834 [Pluteus cervinus]
MQFTVEPQYATNMAPTSLITNSIASHNLNATINFIAPIYYTSQSAIDLDISRLLGRIHELWSERNARAPISQLPPEVVVQIFGWLQTMYHNDAESKRETRRMCFTDRDEGRKDSLEIKWTSVTQVYGYWRRIARGFPSLWNRVMLKNSFWLGESLRCSHPLPLILEEKGVDSFQSIARLRKALISLPRIRIFDVSVSSACRDSVSSLLSQPAPNLEVFKLIGQRPYPRITLLDGTFKGVSPRLRHVALRKVALSWTKATFLTNLTTLSIHSPVASLSVGMLSTILRRMPVLAHLDLKEVLEEMDEDDTDGTAHVTWPKPQAVHLPSLESFFYEGSCFQQDHAFIRLLRFPGRTQVKVQLNPDPEVLSGVDNVPQILDTFTQARIGEAVPIRSINLHFELEEDLALTFAWTNTTLSSGQLYPAVSFSAPLDYSYYSPMNVDIDPPSSSSISTCGLDDPDVLARNWVLQLRTFPLSALEAFRTNMEVTPGALWAGVFKDLPKLREVFLDGSSGAFLLQHLIDNHLAIAAAPSTAPNDITLPSLRRIYLQETDHTHVPVQLHCLAQALATRKLDGSPIEFIKFTAQDYHDFKQFQDLVRELKMVVEEVEWDGWDSNDECGSEYDDDFY